ncbi:hypothetical protein HOB10_02470 [Candidatus Parcubacteria bacterium]|jgi:hypothetical protein|nr:hypothetical protein [Candidatus Parcubacteria bacterium]
MAFLKRFSKPQTDDLSVIKRVVKRKFASGQRFSAVDIFTIIRKDFAEKSIGKKRVKNVLRQLVEGGTLECFPVYAYRSYRRWCPGKGMRRKQNGCEFAVVG